jgi:spermidine synthase
MKRRVELLRDLDRDSGRVLLVDGVEQSYVDIADPAHLEFEYMQHFALAVDATLPPPQPLRCLHLGAGLATMARWVNATRPGSTHLLVDHSPEVLALADELEPVDGATTLVAPVEEALRTLPARAFDLAVWDLYDGPRAVTSALDLDSLAALSRALAPRALALLNVSDSVPFDVVRPVVAGCRELVSEVALLAEPSTLRGRRSGNCVVAAAVGLELPVGELARLAAAAPVRARLVAGTELADFVGAARPGTPQSPLPPPSEARGRAFL